VVTVGTVVTAVAVVAVVTAVVVGGLDGQGGGRGGHAAQRAGERRAHLQTVLVDGHVGQRQLGRGRAVDVLPRRAVAARLPLHARCRGAGSGRGERRVLAGRDRHVGRVLRHLRGRDGPEHGE